MTPNERIIRSFAAQFEPPLNVIRTERINGAKVHDGWQVARWDKGRGIGVTAMVFNDQQLKAYIEAAGASDEKDASEVGMVMAKALGINATPSNGQAA